MDYTSINNKLPAAEADKGPSITGNLRTANDNLDRCEKALQTILGVLAVGPTAPSTTGQVTELRPPQGLESAALQVRERTSNLAYELENLVNRL